MSIIRIAFEENFMWGEDAVLLATDSAGAAAFTRALNDVVQQGTSELRHDDRFLIEGSVARMALQDTLVVWRLDCATARDTAAKAEVLASRDGPGHHYVDISTPAEVLVLSRDEYPDRP